MKILWFAPHFRTGNSAGSLRTWQLARQLVHYGHDVEVVCPAYDPLTEEAKTDGRTRWVSVEIIDGVKVAWTYSTPNDRRSLVSRAIYFISQAVSGLPVAFQKRKPDIIIAASIPITVAFATFVAARVRRIPFAYEVRDIPIEAAIQAGYIHRWIGKFLLQIEKLLYRHSRGVIAVTPGIKKYLYSLGVAQDKVFLNTNGMEEINFTRHIDRAAVREKLNWNGKFVILYAGTLGWLPDIPTLLKAANALRGRFEFLFAIVGDGQKEAEYRSYCEQEGLEQVIFYGRKPRREIPEFCVAADVCVNLFPKSAFWGHMFGNKNFDYLGSATPYIYSGVEDSDTADLIRACDAGLVVEPETPEAFRDGILKIYDLPPEERSAMGKRGRDYVVEHYSRQKLAQEFEHILQKIIAT